MTAEQLLARRYAVWALKVLQRLEREGDPFAQGCGLQGIDIDRLFADSLRPGGVSGAGVDLRRDGGRQGAGEAQERRSVGACAAVRVG